MLGSLNLLTAKLGSSSYEIYASFTSISIFLGTCKRIFILQSNCKYALLERDKCLLKTHYWKVIS